jgi:hypothetical protein
VIEFLLYLVTGVEQHQCRITGMTLDGFDWHRAAALELARCCARNTCKGGRSGPDDQLGPRPGTIGFARAVGSTASAAAQLDQRISTPLAMASIVVFDRPAQCGYRGSQRGSALGIEQSVQPNEPVLRFTDM